MVNPDDIAAAIRDTLTSDAAALAKAGRLAVEQRMQLVQAGRSFGVETTLTGRSELQLMRTAKERGYKVNLVYVGLDDADQSNSRVSERVRRGGHDVPEQDIYRRFDRSLANLPAAIGLSDRVRILDNSDERRRTLLKIDNGQVRTVNRIIPEWARKAIPAELRRLTQGRDQGY